MHKYGMLYTYFVFITVNGNWGSWGSFSPCSKTCKGGIQRRSRQCNNPAPAYNGAQCPGSNIEDQTCNENKDCPGER